MPTDEPTRPAAGDGDRFENNPAPFIIAVVLFLIVAVASYVFLREEPAGRLVAPDSIAIVSGDQIEVSFNGPFRKPYAEIAQVGFALGEDVVHVEIVLHEYECAPGASCAAATESVSAVLRLPQPVGDRRVIVGSGRALADCSSTGTGSGVDTVCE